jgi:hypothetical protein
MGCPSQARKAPDVSAVCRSSTASKWDAARSGVNRRVGGMDERNGAESSVVVVPG